MSKEIERKFIVSGEFKALATAHYRIVQGYLCTNPERTVRIRLAANKAFLTVKGISEKGGLIREEVEAEIEPAKAKSLLPFCYNSLIDKVRYIVPSNNNLSWEVDVFEGENSGLIIAEIELENETQNFTKPKWLGREVTGVSDFYNARLSESPVSSKDAEFKKKYGIIS
jgi:CYTH domain-containing protein